MHRIYSLLRSNKQSGPYSLEELLHLNLKRFDLIWVEGKSGWSYPSEIESLKPFLTETNTTPSANKIDSPQEILEPISKKQKQPTNDPVVKNGQSHAAHSHIYVSLPASTSSPSIAASNLQPVENEESPEAKLERKAQELRNKIDAFTENKKQTKADNELDIKYTRSLDDIKDEYSSWLSEQKKRKAIFPKKQLLVAGCLGALILAGYFISPVFYSKTISKDQILSANEILSSSPNKKLAANDNLQQQENNIATRKIKSKKTETKKNLSDPAKATIKKKEISEVDKYLDSLNSVSNKIDQRKETVVDSENAGDVPPIKNESTTVPFEQLVKLAESNSSEPPHLSLYNNSNKFIRFVAVDVYYLKANKKLLLKKTFYFTDISAMSTAKLYVPKEKGAASVRYEMGLISTDGGLYYAKN